MPPVPAKRRRAAGILAAALALGALGWLWSDAGPGGVSSVPVREPKGAGFVRPVPVVEGWTPVNAGSESDGGMRLYLADESPASAAVRAARAFRSAGWEPLPPSPGDPAGRQVLAFRSGGAVCWVMVEADPRTGRTRCAVTGP